MKLPYVIFFSNKNPPPNDEQACTYIIQILKQRHYGFSGCDVDRPDFLHGVEGIPCTDDHQTGHVAGVRGLDLHVQPV